MFRLLNVADRSALEHDGHWFDLARLSGDPALADPMHAIGRQADLHELTRDLAEREPSGRIADVTLGAPVPRPRQVFGIGLNYRDHASETGQELPPAPLTFTKFPSCITGPFSEVPLSGSSVDWEVEIVVVIGAEVSGIEIGEAWNVIAGLTLGQDISDREVQFAGDRPQFSLGKSFASYGPIGPALVSVDSFDDPADIALWCDVSGERMQSSSTTQLIFSIPTLVAYLSSICTLYPGDLIFTGTPSGVGIARGRLLRPGDVIESGAAGIGALRNVCVEGSPPRTASQPISSR